MTAARSRRPHGAHWRVLVGVIRTRRGLLIRLLAWSAVEAVPAFLAGRLVAAAIDDGFLAARPAAGFGWSGLMALSALVGAVGTRQTYLRLAELVEPFRGELVDRVVSGVLRRCAACSARHGDISGRAGQVSADMSPCRGG